MDTMANANMDAHLTSLIYFLNGDCPVDACNMYNRFYDKSPCNGYNMTGYADYIMNNGGYIQMLANVGLIIQSTYTAFSNPTDETAYQVVQKEFDGPF